MTISLAAVFIPVLFMGGIVGRLFHEFAITIIAAILISGVHVADVDAGAVQQAAAAVVAGATDEDRRVRCAVKAAYAHSLDWVLAHRAAALLALLRVSCC